MIEQNKNSLNINPLDYDNYACDKCGSITFKQLSVIKKIPGVVVGQADKKIIPFPIPVYVCDKCGEIIKADRKMLKLGEFTDNSLVEKKSSIII